MNVPSQVLNILNRTRYGDSDLEIGINRLIDKECYESAFPLHEGDWKLDHMKDEEHHGGRIIQLCLFFIHYDLVFTICTYDTSIFQSGTRLNKRQTLYWIWARPRMAFSAQPLELIR